MQHKKDRQRFIIQNYLTKKNLYYAAVYCIFALVLGIILLFYALMNQSERTTVTQASDNANVQSYVEDFYSRVPRGHELQSLQRRYDNARLSEEEKQRSAEAVYMLVNIPGESGEYQAWRSEDGRTYIEGRTWTGIYDVFPIKEVGDILMDSRLSNSQLQYVLQERQKALKLYLSRFYGYILNDTLFAKYRVEINSFPQEIAYSNKLTDQLAQKGIRTNALLYQPKVAEACLFLEKGYKQLDLIIDRNIGNSDYTTFQEQGYEAFTGYGKISERNIPKMAKAIEQVHDTVASCSDDNATVRVIYMNEVDLLNVYANNSNEDYGRYPIIHPDDYAQGYYKIAALLADKRIIFTPSTFNMGYFGYFWGTKPEENNGVNPWIESMAKYQYLKDSVSKEKQRYIHDYLATNDYLDVEGWEQKIGTITSHIEKANRKHDANITFRRVQEFGILPQQPNGHEYQSNLSYRKEVVPDVISYFAGKDASLFSKPGRGLSPSDGKVPERLLYGNNNPFDMGFLYRDEPELWPVVKEELNSQVTDKEVAVMEMVDQYRMSVDDPSPSAYPVVDTPVEVNCPDRALDAGVTNTCGTELPWRGCYCDENLKKYVNSCGQEGEEDFRPTDISCGLDAPAAESCVKEAPEESIANEEQFGAAMNNFCFTIHDDQYTTCTLDGPHIGGVPCDWCFGGYCLREE